jgi:hypothetical protein
MTTDELGLELTGPSAAPLRAEEVLNVCDRILGEPARRRHLFAWLRPPGAAADEWLPVDGYYPGNKLVVVWHPTPGANDRVYSELVPAHGFRLLELTPEAVGARDQAEARLRARIEALGATPRPARQSQARPARPAQPRPARDSQPRRAQESQARESAVTGAASGFAPAAPGPAEEAAPLGAGFGAVLGVVLTAVLVAEVYLGVAVVGFGHGHPVLAFAFALDACARALGTVGAGHAGSREWAWLCALGGSPLVATFASHQRQREITIDPTPLAGVMSLLAMALAAIAGLVALAGG